jgi:hypothetical protein
VIELRGGEWRVLCVEDNKIKSGKAGDFGVMGLRSLDERTVHRLAGADAGCKIAAHDQAFALVAGCSNSAA